MSCASFLKNFTIFTISVFILAGACSSGGSGTSAAEETPAETNENSTEDQTYEQVDEAQAFGAASFAYKTQGDRGYAATVADVNNDGWYEPLGFVNDGGGNLSYKYDGDIGLWELFVSPRENRDNRVADFNGDGFVDLLANTYSDYDNTGSKGLFFWGNGTGAFSKDEEFLNHDIRGYGETILAADFDNDNDLDAYISFYTSEAMPDKGYPSIGDQCYLMQNDGTGHFTDISDQAGVSLRNRAWSLRAEGAQSLDFNGDGFLDFYVSSRLFINNGDMTFTDKRAEYGLPEQFDEGIKFLDWNNDGRLDLLIHHHYTGPAIYQFDGASFRFVDVIPEYSYERSFGVNVYDVNNDGREDIVTAGGDKCETRIFLNKGVTFERAGVSDIDGLCSDLITFGDINRDGRVDLVIKESVLKYFENTTPTPYRSFTVEVLGPNGEKNQQGRMIKATPLTHTSTIYTRLVDGGSGFNSQTQYPVLIGTPYEAPHRVEVYYATGVVSFTIEPGQRARVYPSGAVDVE